MDYVDDALVETLWKDLDGRVARQQITKEVSKIAARFEEATVTAYVPIFIRRQALTVYLETEAAVGDTVELTVLRGDAEITIGVTLGEEPQA